MLTTRLGYATPRLIEEAGFRPEYEAAMKSAAEMYEKLYAFNPQVAQYIVPMDIIAVCCAVQFARGLSFLPTARRLECTFFHPANCLSHCRRT